MNQLIERHAGSIRCFGFLLNGIGLGLIFSMTYWFESMRSPELLVFGFLMIAVGNILRAARTNDEKKRQLLQKRERYQRLTQKYGTNTVQCIHKTSFLVALALFAVAMLVMVLGSMSFVWVMIFLIVALFIVACLTIEPVG